MSYKIGGPFKTKFSNERTKMLYKTVLVSDGLDHIGRIYDPLNLGNTQTRPEYRTGYLHLQPARDWRIVCVHLVCANNGKLDY